MAWPREYGRYIRIVLGCILIFVGLIGFLLPILQGWLFIALGTLLLYRDLPFLQRMWAWIKRRFPRVGYAAERIRKTFKP
ncbi:hypothetical protein HZA56_03820 [Candidatus Poribacteria bacterium]|nr:hypothetical protein [Candidatus Poribacteria bacterium]